MEGCGVGEVLRAFGGGSDGEEEEDETTGNVFRERMERSGSGDLAPREVYFFGPVQPGPSSRTMDSKTGCDFAWKCVNCSRSCLSLRAGRGGGGVREEWVESVGAEALWAAAAMGETTG